MTYYPVLTTQQRISTGIQEPVFSSRNIVFWHWKGYRVFWLHIRLNTITDSRYTILVTCLKVIFLSEFF